MKAELRAELDACIAKYDLLCHPYYKAWSAGQLTREDLRGYAANYYHHVDAFTGYLEKLSRRLEPGNTQELVLQNKAEEEGSMAKDGRTHADLWLDFAEGMGADRGTVCGERPIKEIAELIATFENIAETGTVPEALAAFYAYESQIPRVAAEKEHGLKNWYGADDRTAYYFKLHKEYDVIHSDSWCEELANEIEKNPTLRESALQTAETAAKALWLALDGIERCRLTATAC